MTLVEYLKALAAAIAILGGIYQFIVWARRKQRARTAAEPSLPVFKKGRRELVFGMPDLNCLFGRAEEVAYLRRVALQEKAQAVVIHGMAGAGKTALAAAFAIGVQESSATDLPIAYRRGVADEFEVFIWWRLSDAPTLKDLARECSGLFDFSVQSRFPEDAEALSSLILRWLNQKRCLVVLDNLETLLESGQSDAETQWISGSENYEILLRQIEETRNRSCVLITTRELPKPLRHAGPNAGSVRVRELSGLRPKAFQSVFCHNNDFTASKTSWANVAARYDGNPLAAQLVANYVEELFDGDIGLFLEKEKQMLPEYEQLLDFHIKRLPGLEKEIIYWLAINRRPVSVYEIREDLLDSLSRSDVVNSVQSLRRRIPIEQAGEDLTVQPVLMEYLTLRLARKVGKLVSLSDEQMNDTVSKLLVDDVACGFANNDFSKLDRFSLMKAFAREHVRESQYRTVVGQTVARLIRYAGSRDLAIEFLRNLLEHSRELARKRHSYLPSNILTLLQALEADLEGLDLTELTILQAYLALKPLRRVCFDQAIFVRSVFVQRIGAVLAIDLQRKGAWLASGDTANSVRVWNIENQQLAAIFSDNRSWLKSVRFINDDSLVAGGHDAAIRIYDIPRRHLSRCREAAHDDWINDIGVSSSQDYEVFSASDDCTVKCWTRELNQKWSADLRSAARALAVLDRHKSLAVGCADGSVRILDQETGVQLGRTVTVLSGAVTAIDVDEDEACLLAVDDRGAIMARTLPELREAGAIRTEDRYLRCVRCLGKKTFATGGDDGQIRVWSLGQEIKLIRTLAKHEKSVRSLRFSSVQKVLYSGSEDQSIRSWDLQSGQAVDVYRGYSNPMWCVKECASSEAIVSAGEDGLVRVWNIRSGEEIAALDGHFGRTFCVASHPSLPFAASAGSDQVILLWNISNRTLFGRLQGHADWVTRLEFVGDGSRLVSTSEDSTVRIWDWREKREISIYRCHSHRVTALGVSPDSTWVASGDENGQILLNSCEGKDLIELPRVRGKVREVAFCPDASRLFSCWEDGSARIWDLKTHSLTAERQIVKAPLWSMAMDLDGQQILVGDDRGQVIVLRADDLGEEARFTVHEKSIWSLHLSKDGNVLYSASDDETVAGWNLNTESTILRVHAERPYEGSSFRGVRGLDDGQLQNIRSLGARA